MNRQSDGLTDEWMKEWMEGWTTYLRTGELASRCTLGRADRLTNERASG